MGNILLGGLVGAAIDAASGANNKYPERVMVILTPASFPSDEARDARDKALADLDKRRVAAKVVPS